MTKIRCFTIGLVLIIFFVTYSQENVYSSPDGKPQVHSTSLNYGKYPSESCSCVAFRLDDFSDTRLDKVKIQIVDTFYQKNSSLTIGIVGDRFGDNEELVNYVKKKIEDESFDLEAGNHGWQHENFSELDIQKQSILLKKTNEKVEEILGVKPKVFIPPFNQFNSDTIEVLMQNNMSYYSAAIKKDYTTPSFSNSDLYHFPMGSSTAKRDPESKKYNGLPHETTLNSIIARVNHYGFAVVMMHPYEYTIIKNDEYTNEINWKQIKELENLLDAIRDIGFSVVTISKINEKFGSAELITPESSGKFIQMWLDGYLPDSLILAGLQSFSWMIPLVLSVLGIGLFVVSRKSE